jgi:glycosyltransferase involved in cell wall biosynthesis
VAADAIVTAPLISVITVVRDAAGTVDDALDSIAAQTWTDREHVVVDGASTDGTLAILERRRSDIAVLVSERDAGLYHAMNKGLALASGEFVAFLNADDVYANARVLETVARTIGQSAADVVWGDLVYTRQDDLRRVVRYWPSQPYREGYLEQGWMPPHPTMFVRRAALAAIGGFDTRFRYHADFEMVVRLFRHPGLRSAHVPEILVRMRAGGHTNRSWRNILQGNRESSEIRRRHRLGSAAGFFARKLVWRIPQYFRRPPAAP